MTKPQQNKGARTERHALHVFVRMTRRKVNGGLLDPCEGLYLIQDFIETRQYRTGKAKGGLGRK